MSDSEYEDIMNHILGARELVESEIKRYGVRTGRTGEAEEVLRLKHLHSKLLDALAWAKFLYS